MGERLCALHWRATPLGTSDLWSPSLKSLVGVVLASKQQMFMAWGPDRVWLYHDAFIPILGAKHPHALALQLQSTLDVSPSSYSLMSSSP